jgi:hypothetical protein
MFYYSTCRLLGCYAVRLVGIDVSEERIASIIRLTKINELFLCSGFRLLVTANVVPSSPILVTMMIAAIRSSETSVLTRATWRNIPEDGILHSRRLENLKRFIILTSV